MFGITGDLDSLGVYVARRGRPEAECLVDEYSQITRNYFRNWVNQHPLDVLVSTFVPGGEEVLMMGVSRKTQPVYDLIANMRSRVMEQAKQYEQAGLTNLGDTATSFGGVIFNPDRYARSLIEVVSKFDAGLHDTEVYPAYRRLLVEMRTDMALALDTEKFKTILNGQYPKEVRLLVYRQMLEYKAGTKMLLERLNLLKPEDIQSILTILQTDGYQLTPDMQAQLKTVL